MTNIYTGKYVKWAVFACIYIIYLLLGFGVTISNDAASNLEQISALNILSRSSHFTFHLFGAGFYYLFSHLLGINPITSVEIMLSTVSISGTAALYFIVRKYFSDEKLAILTAVIYAFTTGVFRFSIQTEYLILVPSFALVSLAFYAYDHPFSAGLVFALGLLTSPFILLFSPAFLLFTQKRRALSKSNFIFLIGFIGLYLLVSFFTIRETVSGSWSYRSVFDFYRDTLVRMNFLRIAAIWVYGYLRSFNILLPIIVAGLVIAWKNHRRLFRIIVLIIVLHLPAAIPEARYGGYQLTVYPFLAILAAIVLYDLYTKKKRVLVLSCIFIYLGINFFIVLSERHFNRQLRDTYVQLEQTKPIPAGSVLFTYQASKPIHTLYAPKFEIVDLLSDYMEDMSVLLPGYSKPDLGSIMASNRQLYLIESGVSMPDDYFKLLFSSFVRGQGAKVKGFGREKLKPFMGSARFIRLPSYPIDVYQIQK
jgi:hypothetical protein